MPNPNIRWVQYKTWSGVSLRGAEPVGKPTSGRHMDRAVWLTSQLEGPYYGTVQSYDGAGMSAGLLHNVAVLPSTMQQGSLFALLRRMADQAPNALGVAGLIGALANADLVLAEDGKLRERETGGVATGEMIRDLFAPPKGKVPRRGEDFDTACFWAEAWNRAFSDPATFVAQGDYAVTWLCAGGRQTELEAYRLFTRNPALDSPICLTVGQNGACALPEALDFAMCVYHSFSVNGPAPAETALKQALATMKKKLDVIDFGKTLIRKLGTSGYGRWHDNPDDKGNRYDSTRLAAWRSGLWDQGLVRLLMPKDLA